MKYKGTTCSRLIPTCHHDKKSAISRSSNSWHLRLWKFSSMVMAAVTMTAFAPQNSFAQTVDPPLDYCHLDHIDLNNIDSNFNGLSGNIAFTNFCLVGGERRSDQGNYILTLFYDLDSPLTYSLSSGSWGNVMASNYSGALGINLYNIDTGTTLLSYADNMGSGFNLITEELNQSVSNNLYEDRLLLSGDTGSTNLSLYVGENNSLIGDGSNINLVDSNGGTLNTLGDIINPLTFSPGALVHSVNLEFNDIQYGSLTLTSNDQSGICCNESLAAIAIPEPSGVFCMSIAGAWGLLRRRRHSSDL